VTHALLGYTAVSTNIASSETLLVYMFNVSCSCLLVCLTLTNTVLCVMWFRYRI